LSSCRVHDAAADRWVSKEENAELWFDLMPSHLATPHRWLEPVG
jgi:hypothetical protein